MTLLPLRLKSLSLPKEIITMAQIFCQGVVPEKVQASELKDYCSVWRLLRNHRKILNSLFIPSVKLTKLSKLFIFKD